MAPGRIACHAAADRDPLQQIGEAELDPAADAHGLVAPLLAARPSVADEGRELA